MATGTMLAEVPGMVLALGHEGEGTQRSVLRALGLQLAFDEMEFTGVELSELALAVLLNRGAQFFVQYRRQRQVWDERAAFSPNALSYHRLIDVACQRRKIGGSIQSRP